MPKKSETIICPLCGEEIKHENYKETHLWSCKKCPFVGFEYYHDNDAKRLRNRLGNFNNRDNKRLLLMRPGTLDKHLAIKEGAEELSLAVKERSDDSSLIYLADALMARITSK